MSTAANDSSSEDSKKGPKEVPIPTRQPVGNEDRLGSVDSSAFYEGDEYDEYDDFGIGLSGGGGGGNSGMKNQKVSQRQNNRGGGNGTVYSAKHVRAKEALQQTKGKKG